MKNKTNNNKRSLKVSRPIAVNLLSEKGKFGKHPGTCKELDGENMLIFLHNLPTIISENSQKSLDRQRR